jgi:hypothetical protein
MKKFLSLFFVNSILLLATPVFFNVNFINGGNITNGTDYVGPYNLTVNNIPISGPCISFFDDVYNGEVWEATEVPITNFSGSEFIQLEEASWLNTQFAIQPNQTIAIQQAIWIIFNTPSTSFSEDILETNNFVLQSELNYDTINLSAFQILVPLEGSEFPLEDGIPQTYLLQVTPEPTFLMVGGLALLVFFKRK